WQDTFKRILYSSAHPGEHTDKQGVMQEAYRYETPRKQWKRWIYAAAAALITGGLTWIYAFYLKEDIKSGTNAAMMSEVVAKKGSRKTMMLPDGTKVWLNADSRLTYKSNFKSSSREVLLEGEAFFDVVKDSSRPFIVHTSGI